MITSRRTTRTARLRASVTLLLLAPLAACGGEKGTGPNTEVEVGSIVIAASPFLIERGYHHPLTAVVRAPEGDTLDIPVVWRSSNERVATIDAQGRFTARDTGTTAVTASTLGVVSPPLAVRVVWQGAAHLGTYLFQPPTAATPGVAMPDSIRVRVLNRDSVPVPGVPVTFAVVAGGGSVSPATDTTDATGSATTRLTLGPDMGVNTVRIAVTANDPAPLAFVESNPLDVSITTFAALRVARGDQQTAQILSAVPVDPAVRLVDAAGNPRAGVPVTFVATHGGRTTRGTVASDVDGVASPGTWTLGDEPGVQTLVATVESARHVFTATATGTPILYAPRQVVAGGFVTCAIREDARVECMGEQPKVGDSTTVNRARPTLTKDGVTFRSLAASPGAVSGAFTVGVSHLCGVGTDDAMYCWGLFALADTAGTTLHAFKPTRVASDIRWAQAAPGLTHNCGLTSDGTAWCWGDNASGQLGDRTATARRTPVPVAGGFRFATIASGSHHTCGLSQSGAAFCWGNNQSGQLGDGTTTNRMEPTAVSGAATFQSLGAGESITCGLGTDGRVSCWGALSSARERQVTPYRYPDAPVFTSLSVGGAHACALTADGTAYCWGSNAAGQVGDSSTTARAEPVRVHGAFRFSSISAGTLHTCAITVEGAVACWGFNRAGELGDSIDTHRIHPRRVVLGANP